MEFGSSSIQDVIVHAMVDYGVKIKLFDCEYVTESREVYQEYMEVFAQKKNGV